jgi:hypothetical protein
MLAERALHESKKLAPRDRAIVEVQREHSERITVATDETKCAVVLAITPASVDRFGSQGEVALDHEYRLEALSLRKQAPAGDPTRKADPGQSLVREACPAYRIPGRRRGESQRDEGDPTATSAISAKQVN